MNSIRSQIFGGEQPERRSLIGSKRPRGAKPDALQSVAIARAESRLQDSRDADRHRLIEEAVRVTHGSRSLDAQLVNLSGGGAMISAEITPKLWDRVDLHLGENGTVECAVRWIRDGRIGLEFAHETHIECSLTERIAVLNSVLARNFPDLVLEPPPAPQPAGDGSKSESDHRRTDPRHPLIWSGLIHYNHASTSVRLRNISTTGALIDCSMPLPVGAALLLDLGNEVTIFGKVAWAMGDQAGLTFDLLFDLGRLAHAKPEVAPIRWQPPAYLSDGIETGSAWDDKWGRLSLNELQNSLEGYLKH
ncbi:PilZ domain-containing protein [Sphingomonas sp.]|uniref:PilZ domain-containing protein n=1 Tax=Sphingomonas sp. TaxID=28214 RepID=UPI00286AD55C|nr:PilZ domain-containing protein [Sphingomonas sp.]